MKVPKPNVTNLVTNPNPEKFVIHGPFLVCRETLMPAYKDKADYEVHKRRFFPGHDTKSFWRCAHCGLFHSKNIAVSSSGDTVSQNKALIDPDFNYPPPPKNWKPKVYKKLKPEEQLL